MDPKWLAVAAVAFAAFVVGVVTMVFTFAQRRTLRTLKRRLQSIFEEEDNLPDRVAKLGEQIRRHEGEIVATQQTVAALQQVLPQAFSKFAIHFYDALPELGGRFSFSLALLTQSNDGVILTALSSRDATRVYAKEIQSGRSSRVLSPEEELVLREAAAPSKAGSVAAES
ncbi:MAG: DUF4446 family protein [Firmicutes bacterium]|nr:DUF4446 family protein [Bacillota bacterium]